jgi:hypothetical protein
VEHSVPTPELVRPWRTATLVATAIAGLELVLLVVAGVVLLGRSIAPHLQAGAGHAASKPKAAARHAPAAKPKPAAPARAVARLPRSKTDVIVFNGNGITGAAAGAASVVTARGYVVKQVGNAPGGGYAQSIVMYRPGFLGEARRFAHDLNVRQVEPLDGIRPAQMHGAELVLIIGASR